MPLDPVPQAPDAMVGVAPVDTDACADDARLVNAPVLGVLAPMAVVLIPVALTIILAAPLI